MNLRVGLYINTLKHLKLVGTKLTMNGDFLILCMDGKGSIRKMRDNLFLWIIIFIISFLLLTADFVYSCTSDYECGTGLQCIKESRQIEGVCVQFEDGRGREYRHRPESDSSRINRGYQQSREHCPSPYIWSYELQLCVR